MKILIIDNDEEFCSVVENFILEIDKFSVSKLSNAPDALEELRNNFYDLIICNFDYPGSSIAEFIEKAKILNKNLNFILISDRAISLETINTNEFGVIEILSKPLNTKQLYDIIKQVQILNKKTGLSKGLFDINKHFNPLSYCHYRSDKCIVHSSSVMKEIIQKLNKIHSYPDIPVLIEGPSGVGKELIAEYLHYYNNNDCDNFIGLNCGAIVENLFEIEIFGYEKGSFTGGNTLGEEGKIKLAENGSLFFDEITEISPSMQKKFLRFIQEREYYKVGGSVKYPVKTRIICATNQSIPQLVKKNLFREDLYYRLNACKISVPPLSERKEDILPLIIYFMQDFNKNNKKNIVEIEKNALDLLINHNWRGNVRELKNAVIKALLFNEKNYLSITDFDFLFSAEIENNSRNMINSILSRRKFDLEGFSKRLVFETLKKFKGNKTQAAKFLGLQRIQMYHRFNVKNNNIK